MLYFFMVLLESCQLLAQQLQGVKVDIANRHVNQYQIRTNCILADQVLQLYFFGCPILYKAQSYRQAKYKNPVSLDLFQGPTHVVCCGRTQKRSWMLPMKPTADNLFHEYFRYCASGNCAIFRVSSSAKDITD